MITILNIETATKNCSVSLSVDGKIEKLVEIAEENFSHAEKLHVFIEGVLKQCNKSLKDLAAIAISQGPGSYTGLRIGVSSVKGLCYGLSIPMIAIDTLEVLARSVVKESGVIVPMIDARRMEVFSCVFDKEYNQLTPIEAVVVDENSFESLYQYDKVYFIGDGASKCKSVLTKDNFVFLDDIIYPSAREMVEVSYQKYVNKDFVDVAYFEPFYLKDFVMATKKNK
ncbi:MULTISPECIES: tRNA (adenosine(37)-N6)-threonylcarbamoyltransferase complex dimerization subunit type 1 TsaB [Myroides]|uniref:tRNA (Adenosine(37)-N6)-threonylcarbamoyltransferase complex dimerization subunit type 1 TsaB n=1 Tax=Myroides albus TaxID=2562892 RepID=A0A6I3LG27_9FLAO|nr:MULTISPECIES: tRNA (adenosine(37)-N6)-threonylcarbamoyltransferase complex dimerization subunit type 1 TsaB [Myroides]MTG96827.1 tRNA (adenosine(37)-N6)-threonylcarbamoyltransferase complex dimerization subunit type 1 TsaB [Myroides albus]MVX36932.1 tRNA (adenosine(37)-N6)-threonylcarbamoyltransferase complex dimerization subunit type 1 TsaB [Myroides sp. LoEW2-1]UVD78423.1 tRNA (adenosine(37)-N6)-threonylcarbamoyltransferase complex dimerization subunit type 1 TsaB [Myroides albus]